ncbi:unnamed protein product [Alopecurus aequalis]
MSEAGPGVRGGGGRRRAKKARPVEFRGVNPRPNGKFGALIRESKEADHSLRWLGTFDTAEDAARAYDAAAVEILGSRAITNFEQPAANDNGGGVSSLLAEPSGSGSGHGTHQQPSGHYIGLSLVGSSDLMADLMPAQWQQVDELLKDMDSTDGKEALMEGAAIPQQISLAGHGDGGRA